MRARVAHLPRFLALACALLGPALGGVSGAAAAEPSGDAAAPLYKPDAVNVIELTLDQDGIDALEAEPDEYVSGGFSLSTNGTPANKGSLSPQLEVGIRLKGGFGSFRNLTEKAAFKIKFNEFVGGQKFLGLKKMTLNNMVQDGSMLHEVLAYRAFRALGTPTPRTGYAYVYLNGEHFGMYLNIETLDDVSLEKRFGPLQEPPQHLYEGEYADDVRLADVGKFEIDEGEDDRSDLTAFATAVEAADPADFSDRVGPFADLREMTGMWAVEKYIGHWDGYAGRQDPGHELPNNYYLYSDPAGIFQMIPWGTDQTWADRSVGFGETAGLLFNGCRADPSCAARYHRALRAVLAEVGAEYDSAAVTTAALLKPWQELEQGSGVRHEYSLGEIVAAVAATRGFIASRPDDLVAYLAGVPGVPASQIGLDLLPASIAADGQATTTATATVSDSYGNPAFGDAVEFSSTDPGQTLGPVIDHGDGTYTVQITSSTAAGGSTITATDESVDPDLSDTAILTQTVGAASQIELSLQPDSITADGQSTTTATAEVEDAFGNPVSGDAVEFSSTDPGQQIGPVSDRDDGTYTVQITSSTAVGGSTITVSDESVDPVISASAILSQASIASSPPVVNPPAILPPPVATISRKPPRRTRSRRPVFEFVSDRPGATFRCQVDDRRPRSCTSPRKLGRLGLGPHVFSVTAVGGDGQLGPAAVHRFFIKPPPK